MVGVRGTHLLFAFIDDLTNDAEAGRKLMKFAEEILLEQPVIQMPNKSGCFERTNVSENNNWRKSKRGFNGYNRSY